MNDGTIIGILAFVTIGFVLVVAIAHFAWMMKDRKMRRVAGGAHPNDVPFLPYTGLDLVGVVLIAVLLFGALAQGIAHTHIAI